MGYGMDDRLYVALPLPHNPDTDDDQRDAIDGHKGGRTAQVSSRAESHVRSLTVSGGEPLMQHRFVVSSLRRR